LPEHTNEFSGVFSMCVHICECASWKRLKLLPHTKKSTTPIATLHVRCQCHYYCCGKYRQVSFTRSPFAQFCFMWLNILHHFLNLHDTVRFTAIWHRYMIIFGFNVIWHRQNVTALVFCWRLAKRVATVVPSVTCMDWLHWWHKHAAGVVPAWSILAFGKKMNEKCNYLT
jgi:hypothetical protein